MCTKGRIFEELQEMHTVIPYNLHQIWVGPHPIPKRERGFANQLIDLHPDYEYKCWSDLDIDLLWDDFSSEFQSEYKRMYNEKRYAWCADLLRLWLVHRFGGIYLDIDFEPLKPLPETWMQYDGAVFYHRNEADCLNGEMSNSMIGGRIGLPMLQYCLDRVGGRNNWWYGPSWFGTLVKESMGMTNQYTNTELLSNLQQQNVLGVCFEDVNGTYIQHQNLYSWSDNYIPENK